MTGSTGRHAPDGVAGASETPELGLLPEWNLIDLYPSMDSPLFKADLERGLREAEAFGERYRGKLGEMAAGPDASEQLAEAVKAYEALSDLLGRIGSYAGLIYAGDTTDPLRAKFYGDTQEKLTTISTALLFFGLELNRIDTALLEKAASSGPLAHWKPWLDDLAKDKPHELDDRLEQLFHEKSLTGRSAWNRLFDETIAALRVRVDGEELTLELTLNKLQDRRAETRKAAAEALGEVLRGEMRTFSLISNTLAKDKEISDRWRKFEDVADSRHLANRVEREVVDALAQAVRRGLSTALPPVLQAQGTLVRAGRARLLGPATHPCRRWRSERFPGKRHRRPCSTPMARFRREWRTSRAASSARVGSMRLRVPARRRAPLRIRQCRPPTPMSC